MANNIPRVIKLQVLPVDIKNGVRKEPDSCPLALAAKRRFRRYSGNPSINVDAELSIEFDTGRMVVYNLTVSAADFMRRFDSGKTVRPITYTLHLDHTEDSSDEDHDGEDGYDGVEVEFY